MWAKWTVLNSIGIFSALSQIAKHSVDLAEMVVEAEIFPAVLTCLKGIQVLCMAEDFRKFMQYERCFIFMSIL